MATVDPSVMEDMATDPSVTVDTADTEDMEAMGTDPSAMEDLVDMDMAFTAKIQLSRQFLLQQTRFNDQEEQLTQRTCGFIPLSDVDEFRRSKCIMLIIMMVLSRFPTYPKIKRSNWNEMAEKLDLTDSFYETNTALNSG